MKKSLRLLLVFVIVALIFCYPVFASEDEPNTQFNISSVCDVRSTIYMGTSVGSDIICDYTIEELEDMPCDDVVS